jgi:hypothetical protein
MSTPLGYHADPWGRTSGEPELPSWVEGPVSIALGQVPSIARQALGQDRQEPPPPPFLWQVIPDDPNYAKYVPITFRLNARSIVAYLADDLRKGKAARIWVELAHHGVIPAAESRPSRLAPYLGVEGTHGVLMGVDTVTTVAEAAPVVGLIGSIAAPFLVLAGGFMELAEADREAAEKRAKDYAATGYSRGAVMGANRRSVSQLREFYGNFYPPADQYLRGGEKIAKANHDVGLAAGYLHGRVLTDNQKKIFFRDLGSRMGDQSYRAPTSQWRSRDLMDWSTDTAAAFRRYHLTA